MKTLQLIAKHHEFVSRGYAVKLLTPSRDTRHGLQVVRSRAGVEIMADGLLYPDSKVNRRLFLELDPDRTTKWVLLLDEVQFLTKETVDSVRSLVDKEQVEAYAFGLRTDFATQLFDGSRRLLEVADTITVLRCDCTYCTNPATFNLRLLPIKEQVLLGGDDLYAPVCSACYHASADIA